MSELDEVTEIAAFIDKWESLKSTIETLKPEGEYGRDSDVAHLVTAAFVKASEFQKDLLLKILDMQTITTILDQICHEHRDPNRNAYTDDELKSAMQPIVRRYPNFEVVLFANRHDFGDWIHETVLLALNPSVANSVVAR